MANGKPSETSLGKKVHAYASSHLGGRVGRGECYDLADYALKHAGAKSAPDYGKITASADYKWGKKIDLLTARPGDILQFRNHKIKIVTTKNTKKTHSDGSWEEIKEKEERSASRPHHTAIVSSKKGKGTFTIFEQNVPPPSGGRVVKKVQSNTIRVSGSKNTTTTVRMEGKTKVEVKTTTVVTVTGTIWVYRPEPK